MRAGVADAGFGILVDQAGLLADADDDDDAAVLLPSTRAVIAFTRAVMLCKSCIMQFARASRKARGVLPCPGVEGDACAAEGARETTRDRLSVAASGVILARI